MRQLDVDFVAPEIYRDGFPHHRFDALRRESAVWHHPGVPTRRDPAGTPFWMVIGHPELQEVTRDWERFSVADGSTIGPTSAAHRGHTLVSSDPPEHTRLRKLVNTGFTPRMIARLDELVERRAVEILDAAAALGDCDFVRDVAHQLPMHIIADIMGIPDADRAEVFEWTDVIMRCVDPLQGISADEQQAAERAMFEYAEALGREKRANPADDVWSILATAEIDDDDGTPTRLSSVELDMFFLILAIAGSETTRGVIAAGLMTLLDHRDQMELLRSDPAGLVVATEELLRWTSPVTCHTRTATGDLELDGQPVRAGDRVSLWFPVANRDPRAFADPDRFDVTRQPNPQVAFGAGGLHFCLGAHLARREIRVMFEQLLTRFPAVEITGSPRYVVGGLEGTIAVSLDSLPVRLAP